MGKPRWAQVRRAFSLRTMPPQRRIAFLWQSAENMVWLLPSGERFKLEYVDKQDKLKKTQWLTAKMSVHDLLALSSRSRCRLPRKRRRPS